MTCISEFSFPHVNYFIFKNFQRRVRILENERSWKYKFGFQLLVLIKYSLKVQPIKNLSNLKFQSLTQQVFH